MLVSDRRLAGERLGELHLEDRFGVSATRVRRGDTDFVASDSTKLALGDRVRVVGPADGLARVARALGDSERHGYELDAAGFAIGIAVGLAVGEIPIPLPGAGELRLGAGGGPLLVGLLLGTISRVGPITFQLPHAANLVLRQLGVLLFLAAAGVGSGATFADAIQTNQGLELVLVGAIVSTSFALLVPLVIEVILRRDTVETAGFFAGIETQPAALAYAVDRTAGDDRVNLDLRTRLPRRDDRQDRGRPVPRLIKRAQNPADNPMKQQRRRATSTSVSVTARGYCRRRGGSTTDSRSFGRVTAAEASRRTVRSVPPFSFRVGVGAERHHRRSACSARRGGHWVLAIASGANGTSRMPWRLGDLVVIGRQTRTSRRERPSAGGTALIPLSPTATAAPFRTRDSDATSGRLSATRRRIREAIAFRAEIQFGYESGQVDPGELLHKCSVVPRAGRRVARRR